MTGERVGGVLRVERRGSVGCITLNRPDQVNAVNDAIRTGVPAAIAEFERDRDIRAVLLCGEGPRGFCAGADVKELRDAETPLEVHRRLGLSAWIESVASARKPIVAAIHGACMGGGLELALACDIRIAAPEARFALPEVRLGLIPGGGGTQRLMQIVGLGQALDMLITGKAIDAQEAFQRGVVTRMASSGASLLEEAMEIAAAIASLPPSAVAFAKEAALATAAAAIAPGLALERSLFGLLLTSEDRVEAAAAFREKREAKFTGR